MNPRPLSKRCPNGSIKNIACLAALVLTAAHACAQDASEKPRNVRRGPQQVATFTITSENPIAANTPVSINLDSVTSLPASQLKLEEISQKGASYTPIQIETNGNRVLWWILSEEIKPGAKKTFQLAQGSPSEVFPTFSCSNTNGSILLQIEHKPVLQYQYGMMAAPPGVDSSYRRSGFIHPIWSPQGSVLTQIQPKDHYHHYGIWNPWTKTMFEGEEIDFWNIGSKKGTVRHKKLLGTQTGPVFGSFSALLEHVVHPGSPKEKVAMNEIWNVKVFNYPSSNGYLWEFSSTLSMADLSPILLETYRYGGFGFRATQEWNATNSLALTSEGKNRKDADGSTGRWAFIEGQTEKGHPGILFMSHPTNYNHPEPIRMWPEDINGRGDVFFNFSPTKNKDWSLAPGKEYKLKYRILVYEGIMTKERAEAVWNSFARPPEIKVTPTLSL